MSDTSDLITQMQDYITQLQSYQDQLASKLGDVEVDYSQTTNSDISNAVKQVFGTETSSSTDSSLKTITLEMYLTCLDIIRQSGKSKATSLTSDKVYS